MGEKEEKGNKMPADVGVSVRQAAKDLHVFAVLYEHLSDAMQKGDEHAWLGTEEYNAMSQMCELAGCEADLLSGWLNKLSADDAENGTLAEALVENAAQLIRFGHIYMEAVPCLIELHRACGISAVVVDTEHSIRYTADHDMFRLYDAYRDLLFSIRSCFIPMASDPDQPCEAEDAPWYPEDLWL